MQVPNWASSKLNGGKRDRRCHKFPLFVCAHGSVGADGERKLEDIQPIVLHGLPSDEKTEFHQRKPERGRVAYESGGGRGAKVSGQDNMVGVGCGGGAVGDDEGCSGIYSIDWPQKGGIV